MTHEERYIHSNGINLHVILAGPEDGEPIIFLHGFPEFWRGWKQQIPYFAERGYRVIVPDQRGYNLSDKPSRVADYHLNTLATDISALADALGYEQFHLVGHDWGAVVSWWVATLYPHRLKTLSILNVPYPTLMTKVFREGNWRQVFKSWYMFFFQLPWLPEALIRLNHFKFATTALERSSRRGTFTEDDFAQYRAAWGQPRALTSMLNWYRWLVRNALNMQTTRDPAAPRPASPKRQISVPTQVLWGEKDIFLGKELAQPSADLCQESRVIFYPQATHWVQHEEAPAINQAIAEWVAAH